MEWDLQEFGWESGNDLDPSYDHRELGFAGSAPRRSKSPSSEPNSGLVSNAAAGTASSPSSGKKVASSCLVDGCKADLSGCRDYHRRHRVCEQHSKTPTVVVKGEEKRFCQQCSRFHYLGEFDEVKRSCRKRLDGHNRRRRKSQPEPLYFSSKSFLSGFKGPRILHFGNPQLYATGNVKTPWTEETKPKPKPKPESWLYGTNQSPQISFNVGLRARHGPYQTTSREQILSHQFHPPERGRSEEDPMMIPVTRRAPSDEEVTLPIDSGGRALYLLSTNLTPSFQPLGFDPVSEAPPESLTDPSYFFSGPISLD